MIDLLIVGGGPAGMAAASDAHVMGLSVLLIDENPGLGGQVYRSVGSGAVADPAVLGPDYHAGKSLVDAVEATGIRVLLGATVWMIEEEDDAAFSVGVSRAGESCLVRAQSILIATGALERPFPIPGWTMPGVMTAGAGQSLLKASGVVPEGPLVLAGTGPLLYLLAAQYARADVPIAAVLDTTPRGNWGGALKHLPAFLASTYLLKGIRLLAEVRRATRVVQRVARLAAVGADALREVRYFVGGRESSITARTLMLHQGVVPQINLGMAAGCDYRWNDDRLAFEPTLGPCGETSRPGVFIAGDSSGIGGAHAAEASGRVAALGVVAYLGRATHAAQSAAGLRRIIASALRGRAFLNSLYRPSPHFRMPADDVVICRCEEVTAGAVRAVAHRGAPGPNQAKTFLRAGMGICQGRLCGLTITEIMADATGRSPAAMGHFRLRNPVKPLTLGELASARHERCDWMSPNGAGEGGSRDRSLGPEEALR